VSEDRSFQGPTRPDGARDRRLAGLIVVLLVAFLGVAIAKPWGVPESSGPTATSSGTAGPLPTASLLTTRPEASSAAISSTAGPPALDGGFTTPIPPDAVAPWKALRWHRLAHDPLTLVTSALRWRGGFVALGRVGAGSQMTPVWTSTDGARWDLLPFNTSTTFWPGMLVVGVAEVGSGLVALTESAYRCSGSPCSPTYVPPTVSWTSPDGRGWTPHALLPTDWLSGPTGGPALFTVGTAGVVAASSGPAARIATSTDGAEWQYLPTSTLPSEFALDDLRGTSTGYVAVGRWPTGDNRREAASLWSGDGRHWSESPALLPTSSDTGSNVGSAVTSLVVAGDGIIAVGRDDTTPGATLWWQSSDGRRWQPLPTFAPLGPMTCTGDGCGLQPNGALAGDGQRMLAVRGGPDAGAWESLDGHSWRQLDMTGEVPGGDATQVTLLPGGVLVTDGSTTWFGEALVH
jgi:hypothetical protein